MPKKQYPSNPSLAHFKHQAKDLLNTARQNGPSAIERFREFHPRFRTAPTTEPAAYSLGDAQLVIAREYDFASWVKLRECMAATDSYKCMPHKGTSLSTSPTLPELADEFLRLTCLNYGQDHPSRWARARALWNEHPEIRAANIYVAAATGDISTIQRLITEEPQLAKSRGGPYHWEPILYTAYSRFDCNESGYSTLEAADLLLKNGADPNAGYLWEGFYLFTALTGVFGEGEAGPVNQPPHQYEKSLAKLLLQAGADPNDGQSLYNRMFTKGISHLELLFSYGLGQPHKGPWPQRMGGKLNSPEKMLSDQLSWAVSHDHFDRVQLLAARGVDLNRTCHGKTPYESALLSGNQEIAKFLLENGASKTSLDPIEAFSAACMSADRAEVQVLLNNDPSLLEKSAPHQNRLLTMAAGSHRLAAVHLMIDLGFDINSLGRNTALHEAAWAGDIEMITLLLSLGADRDIQDRAHNATPLQWAEYNHKDAAIELLRNQSAEEASLPRPAESE